MINSREFSFIQSLFSKEETKSLFSKIKEHYQNDVTGFFENLILYVFTYSETIDFTIDEHTFNASVELLENHKEQFIELLQYNNELKIHSELLDFILAKDKANLNEYLSISDIKQALKEIERKNLKDSFKHLDERDFLSYNDIFHGFRDINKTKFKERFKEIDDKDNLKTPIFKLNFSQISKYAAILLVVLILSYFFKNRELSSDQVITSEKNTSNKVYKTNRSPYSPIDVDIASALTSKQNVLQIPLLDSQNSNSSLLNIKSFIHEIEIELSISRIDTRKYKQLLASLIEQLKDYPEHENEINSKITYLKTQIITHKNNFVFNRQKCLLKLNEVFDSKTMKNYSIVCLSNGFIEHFYLKYKNDYFELLESNTISNLVQTKDEKILKNLIAIN